MTKSSRTESGLAAYVKQRVTSLGHENMTRVQIAKAAGFESDETLFKVETGQIKLPLDRTIALADALQVDRRDFVFLALGQFAPTDLVDLLIDDPELNAVRTEAQAALVAAQVEVAVIGEHAKEINEAALAALKASTEISARQAVVLKALAELRNDINQPS